MWLHGLAAPGIEFYGEFSLNRIGGQVEWKRDKLQTHKIHELHQLTWLRLSRRPFIYNGRFLGILEATLDNSIRPFRKELEISFSADGILEASRLIHRWSHQFG